MERKKYFLIMLIAIVAGAIPCYHLLYHPKIVNSNIAKPFFTLTQHKDNVWVAKFSPDGNIFATASVDSTIKLFNTDGKEIRTIKQACGVTYLAFSSDGQYIATSGYDAKVRLWSVA